MVELTGVPYADIMAAALLPAVLYFVAVWIGIDAFAQRYDLRPLEADQRPETRIVLITAGFFAVPFAVLLERMFNGGYTPQYAACVAILVAFALLFLDGRLTLDWGRTRARLETMCLTAGQQIATIASIILCASIIIGVLGMTGLGVKITSVILSWSGGQLWGALLLTALACLILGMEVPTTAAYVICVSVAGPALQQLGLDPLLTHLFVFWFALLSTITPPVCGAVFIAAGMVEENWLKVAVSAMALGIGLYLIPLGMVAAPALIELKQAPIAALLNFVRIAVALGVMSYGIIAPLNGLLRIGLIAGGAALLFAPVLI
jgi:TRAP-type uncharacterized transport system fused permease subunit